MDVSIILVSYNTKELTRNCLNSVFEKTQGLFFEVFVVDNHSQDGSVEMLKEEFPQIKLIENERNLGFGAANNIAIKQSSGKYVFLLNTDTLLVDNAVKKLFDFMQNHADCGACGGNLFDEDMNPVHSFGYGDDLKSLLLKKSFLKFLLFWEYFKIKNYEKNKDKTLTQEVNHITGADLMIRKSVLDEVGLFNEKIFLYFEENELEFRIKKAGYKICFVADAKIIHFGQGSYNPQRDSYYSQGFILFYELAYGKFWAKIAKILQFPRSCRTKLKLYFS